MAHNPEVAGSNPAPAIAKAPETGPSCFPCRDRLAKPFVGLTAAPVGHPASVLTRALAVAAACAVLLAGCNGGTVDRHALTNDAASVDSMACEGALLAHDVARGKTTVYFVREQAEALRIQSFNLANALAKRKALASIEQKVRAKSKDAAKLSATLQRLRDHPSDRGVAASVEQQLKKLGGCA